MSTSGLVNGGLFSGFSLQTNRFRTDKRTAKAAPKTPRLVLPDHSGKPLLDTLLLLKRVVLPLPRAYHG